MAQYDNNIDDEPTADSDNLVKSGGVVSYVATNGSAFDISVANASGGVSAEYADLAAALGTNGANVPSAVRKGGMSVKFIQQTPASYSVVVTPGVAEAPTGGVLLDADPEITSGSYTASDLTALSTESALPTSVGGTKTYYFAVTGDTTTYTTLVVTLVQSSDNKYVQYRYMLSSTTNANFANVKNWRGEDDVLVNNLGVEGFDFSSVPYINNKIILNDGSVADTNNYRIYSPIHLLAGETFAITMLGGGTQYATISIVTDDGQGNVTYTPVYTRYLDNQYYLAYYTATADCDIAICTRWYNTAKCFKCTYWGYFNYLVSNTENILNGIEYSNALIQVPYESYIQITYNSSESTLNIVIPQYTFIGFGKSFYRLIDADVVIDYNIYNGQALSKVVFNKLNNTFYCVRRDLKLSSDEVLLFTVDNRGWTSLPINEYRFSSNNDPYYKILTSYTDIENTKKNLGQVGLGGLIIPVFTKGNLIKPDGTTAASNNWYLSNTIPLLAGETIAVSTIIGSGTQVAIIAIENATDPVTYTSCYNSKTSDNVYQVGIYTAVADCNVVLSVNAPTATKVFKASNYGYLNYLLTTFEEKKNLLDTFIKDVKYSPISNVQWTAGTYIKPNGTTESSSNYAISNIIPLTAGQTIFLNTRSAGTMIANIAIVTDDGQGGVVYTSVADGFSSSGYYNCFYTATENCNVILCTRYTAYTNVYILDSNGFFNWVCKQIKAEQDDVANLRSEIQSTIYQLPTSFKNRVEELNSYKGTQFSFLIQTDTHYIVGMSHDVDYGNDLKEMTKYVGFDFAANMGDIIEGYANMTKELYRESMTTIMTRYINGICCPFIYLKGNHENNSFYAITLPTPADGYIYDPEIYGRTMVLAKDTEYGWQTNGRVMYGYRDFDDADIRVICLNTSSVENTPGSGIGGFGIDDAQLAWFTNVALNTTKKIIVMSHVPLISDIDPDNTHNNNASIRQVLPIIKNFKDNGGTVIGCFCGHIHADMSKQNDGIWHISFDKGRTCTAVFVDTANKTINTKTLGYSNDRTFSYT